jgi:hypothetical protein
MGEIRIRESVAAIGVIRRSEGDQTHWLAQWNAKWNAYALVGGHKWPKESFRACVIREIDEVLGLVEGADFLIADKPIAHLEYTAWSASAEEETAYTMELFDIDLNGEDTYTTIDANQANRWLTEKEVQTQQTSDGKSVSQTMARVLSAVGLLRENGSTIENDN